MDTLTQIIEWAKKEEPIQALVLQGSRATDAYDDWSDYDLAVYATIATPYLASDLWLQHFGPIWVCVHDQMGELPTRLVIFKDGTKVDFTFVPLNTPLPESHKILLNKNVKLEPAERKPVVRPDLERLKKEFWFEAYHVAIAIVRKDIWNARWRTHSMLEFLLPFLECKARYSLMLGKNMSTYLDEKTCKEVQGLFIPDQWQALFNTLALFRLVAGEYPFDQQMTAFFEALRDGRVTAPLPLQ